MPIISPTQQALLKAPHIGRCFFAKLYFPDGIKYLHNGFGDVTYPLDGEDQVWRGMSSADGGVLVGISEIEDPRFGTAPNINLVLAGVDLAYMKSIKDIARDIEGRRADVYFAVIDPETADLVIGLTPLFPLGRMSAPRLKRSATMNVINLSIESFFSSQNFPFGGMWNDANQQKQYAGDKGLSLIGTEVNASRQ